MSSQDDQIRERRDVAEARSHDTRSPNGPRKQTGPRWFLAQDQSCHWYLVPDSRRSDWSAWRDIPEDDERSWTAPDYAIELGCHPSLVSFLDPRLDGRAWHAPGYEIDLGSRKSPKP